jgi:thiosulfate dehydrogenase
MKFSKKRIAALLLMAMFYIACNTSNDKKVNLKEDETLWYGSNRFFIERKDTLVRYGYELISNTAYYLGPKGVVAHNSNGMNCQNCHLEAGTIPWGNNYGAVAATYPKFRDRSNSVESICKRVNDCLERSLNGKALDTNSHEMKAIVAYMKWLGRNEAKGKKPKGSGVMDIAFLDRTADKQKGEKVYIDQCQSCHNKNGEGQQNEYGYTYPPLWGNNSFNTAAGLYRLSRMAGFIKCNMPYQKASYDKPLLTNEEAWDVAAYIIAQNRPDKKFVADWQNISKKPFDYSFAPFADTFSSMQHQFGPFKPIVDFKKARTN